MSDARERVLEAVAEAMPWGQPWNRTLAVKAVDAALSVLAEKPCEPCGGRGWLMYLGNRSVCEPCGGSGSVPAEWPAVLELVAERVQGSAYRHENGRWMASLGTPLDSVPAWVARPIQA